VYFIFLNEAIVFMYIYNFGCGVEFYFTSLSWTNCHNLDLCFFLQISYGQRLDQADSDYYLRVKQTRLVQFTFNAEEKCTLPANICNDWYWYDVLIVFCQVRPVTTTDMCYTSFVVNCVTVGSQRVVGFSGKQ